jgi:hypothetical protein
MDNKRIRVTELDFDQVKDNFKNFLKGQDQFQDYDFEGSGISVLLDILAYNTHYNAMYANLAMNEAFLDSASKRNNVVSHAKSLGYIPISAKCAEAVVTITVLNPTDSPATLTLPAYTQFSTSINGVNYNFYTRNALTIVPVDGEYVFGLSVSKNHITIAPWGEGVIAKFLPKLKDYEVNKKTIRVPVDWKVDTKLLVDMATASIKATKK